MLLVLSRAPSCAQSTAPEKRRDGRAARTAAHHSLGSLTSLLCQMQGETAMRGPVRVGL